MEREYLKIFMEYESHDLPVLYFYELNLPERLVNRSVEIFRDGHAEKFESAEDFYRDVIEICPIETAEEINEVWGEKFHAFVITKEEFEEVLYNKKSELYGSDRT